MRQPIFNKTSALGRWYGAEEIVDFHVVEGRVTVSPDERADYSVAVAVPIEFVKFVRDIGHAAEKVELYLDQDDRRSDPHPRRLEALTQNRAENPPGKTTGPT